jgi:DNA invertase Pin-like site-specific DNA recombinase
MSEKIGYARVSTRDQNLDGQLDLLRAAGCERIFEDKESGVSEKRPGWDRLMEYVRPGDSIVVTEISRMTRSVPHLFALVKEFKARSLNLTSLRENIDTTTATGRAFLGMMGVINQMERELRAERAAAGRAAARARGRSGGRPRTASDLLEKARTLYESGGHTATDICKTLGIGRRTFYRHLETKKKENS